MNQVQDNRQEREGGRLVSLDFFRGFTMLLLVNGGVLHYFARPQFEGTIAYVVFKQFTHPEWEGFHLWDLVQPFFMFIVGVAIPFSVARRLSRGQTWSELTKHAAQRSIILILLGITLDAGIENFNLTFQNVLAQIGFTYIIAFLLIRSRWSVQLTVSIGLILVTEVLYRLFPMEGVDPFVKGQTFGDLVNRFIAPGSRDNWASFNAIPTAAHTIWGALCGQLLQKEFSGNKKLKILITGGLSALVVGYVLTPVSSVIKRICTSSFVFISGGWAILTLALLYWIIDLKGHKRWTTFAVVVGMNSIFIYLFHPFIEDAAHSFTGPWINLLFGWTSRTFVEVTILATGWFLNWFVCYLLYKWKLFIKI